MQLDFSCCCSSRCRKQRTFEEVIASLCSNGQRHLRSGPFSGLDAVMRRELRCVRRELPNLIADQEPVDEAGRQRALVHVRSRFEGTLPGQHSPRWRGWVLLGSLVMILWLLRWLACSLR